MTLYIRRRSKVRSCDGGESVMCLVKVAHAHLFNVRPATFVTCNLPHRSRPSVNASPTECSHNAVNLNLEYVLYYTIKALCISRSGRLMCRISGASYMSQRLELSSAITEVATDWHPCSTCVNQCIQLQLTASFLQLSGDDDDDDDDDDESISYVRPLLQPQTVTSVLMIRSDEQFSFQIATERGRKVAAAVLEESSTWTVLQQRSCEDRSGLFLWLEQRDHHAQPSAGDDGQRYRRPRLEDTRTLK